MKGRQKAEGRMKKSDHAPVSSPEGTTDNSPAFQRWEKSDNAQVPKGRPNLEGQQPRHVGKFQTLDQLPPLPRERAGVRGIAAPTLAIGVNYTLSKSILEKIWFERLRQKQLLRESRIAFACDSPVVSHDRKLRVLTEELGEVAGAIDRIENFNPLRQPRAELSEPSTRARKHLCDELTQVAAVAIAWLESLQKDNL